MAYYEQSIEQEAQKISKINAAGLINITLINLWNDFYRHLRQANLMKANSDLNCLWIEFGGDLKEGSDEEKKLKKIEIGFKNHSLVSSYKKGFEKITKDDLTNITNQREVLMKKAAFLKRLQNKQGKGTAYYDESADDWE